MVSFTEAFLLLAREGGAKILNTLYYWSKAGKYLTSVPPKTFTKTHFTFQYFYHVSYIFLVSLFSKPSCIPPHSNHFLNTWHTYRRTSPKVWTLQYTVGHDSVLTSYLRRWEGDLAQLPVSFVAVQYLMFFRYNTIQYWCSSMVLVSVF